MRQDGGPVDALHAAHELKSANGKPLRNWMLHETDFYDEVEQIWGRRWGAEGIGRLRADAFDELEPGGPHQPEVAPYTRRLGFGDRIDAELRELFVQGRVGRFVGGAARVPRGA